GPGRRVRPDPPRPGRKRLRAVPPNGRAALAPEDRRGARAPRRAPLPDGAPVLGAVAQARLERGGDGDRAAPRGRDRTGAPAPPAHDSLSEARDRAARHARADVA